MESYTWTLSCNPSLYPATIYPERPLHLVLFRVNHFTRFNPQPSLPGHPHEMFQQYRQSAPMVQSMFPFPLRDLLREEDLVECRLYISQLLCSFNFTPTDREELAAEITANAIELAAGNYDVDYFCIVANIDYVHNITEPLDLTTFIDESVVTTVAAEFESVIERLTKEKLEELKDELGDCSVCFEGLNDDQEVIRTPCDHIYHESCIFAWLENNSSCPLCRRELQD